MPDPSQYDGPEYFREYLEQEPLFRGFFRQILGWIEPWRRPPGRLLEVGCSVGLLLDTARERGWEPSGIDVAPWAVSRARERGLEARVGQFGSGAYPPGSFDVVVLNHVLEHVPAPLEMLAACREVLRPGGVLFVGAPNFGSIMARVEREHWPALQPDEHVWQFSPATLGRLLRRAGFEPRRRHTGLQPRNYGPGVKDRVKRVLYPLATRLNGGEIMNVVASPR